MGHSNRQKAAINFSGGAFSIFMPSIAGLATAVMENSVTAIYATIQQRKSHIIIHDFLYFSKSVMS